MVLKLVELSKKNIILKIVVEFMCRLIFAIVNIWNEFCGFLRIHGIYSRTYKSLINVKNSHVGERCFIVATGPSLTLSDLELLKNEVTFGMNSIVKKYEQTNFRPTYYIIQDHIVYKELKEEILKYYSNERNIFISDRIKHNFTIPKSWHVFPLNMSYHAYKRWFKEQYFVKFSDNVFRTVYSGYNVTFSAIELAAYMGFKTIYLIGTDCSYSNNKPMHFAEYSIKDPTILTAGVRNTIGFEVAKEYANTHNIRIINVTRGGELEVFERKTLEEVLSKREQKFEFK